MSRRGWCAGREKAARVREVRSGSKGVQADSTVKRPQKGREDTASVAGTEPVGGGWPPKRSGSERGGVMVQGGRMVCGPAVAGEPSGG